MTVENFPKIRIYPDTINMIREIANDEGKNISKIIERMLSIGVSGEGLNEYLKADLPKIMMKDCQAYRIHPETSKKIEELKKKLRIKNIIKLTEAIFRQGINNKTYKDDLKPDSLKILSDESPKVVPKNPLGIEQKEFNEKIRRIEIESGIRPDYQQLEKEKEEEVKVKRSYPIELDLEGDPYDVIKDALLLRYKWTMRNNRELSQYLKETLLPYNLYLHLEPIKDILLLDEVSRKQPELTYDSRYIQIADPYLKRKRFYWTFTFKRLFNRFEIPLPTWLYHRANEIIIEEEQLEDSHIFRYLQDKALNELNIAFIEDSWDNIKDRKIDEKLKPQDKMDLMEVKLKLMSVGFESLRDHEIYKLLIEKLNLLFSI